MAKLSRAEIARRQEEKASILAALKSGQFSELEKYWPSGVYFVKCECGGFTPCRTARKATRCKYCGTALSVVKDGRVAMLAEAQVHEILARRVNPRDTGPAATEMSSTRQTPLSAASMLLGDTGYQSALTALSAVFKDVQTPSKLEITKELVARLDENKAWMDKRDHEAGMGRFGGVTKKQMVAFPQKLRKVARFINVLHLTPYLVSESSKQLLQLLEQYAVFLDGRAPNLWASPRGRGKAVSQYALSDSRISKFSAWVRRHAGGRPHDEKVGRLLSEAGRVLTNGQCRVYSGTDVAKARQREKKRNH